MQTFHILDLFDGRISFDCKPDRSLYLKKMLFGNMAPRAVDGDLMLEDKVKFFKEKLNGLHDICRRVSEKKSPNAQDKDEFSNYNPNTSKQFPHLYPKRNLNLNKKVR
ncbi:hypothetical protein AVEN_200827-1 [Araneus ventricosus]|uniref:Uncharacterized protein n=1 Tax=Araneus ventricosus TaxID=182803 RepID=A0A4Y2CHB8_ARAVE|nr:hypothetical protein AVEN_200827-1 [Araneus ventricosus]